MPVKRALLALALIGGSVAVPLMPADAMSASPFHPVDPTITRLDVPLISTSTLKASPQGLRGPLAAASSRRHQRVTRTGLAPFGLAAVTWNGGLDQRVGVRIRVHESAGWTAWHQLSSREEIADAGSAEAAAALTHQGTEPLLTSGHADGVDVEIHSSTNAAISNVQVVLIDGRATDADALAVQPNSFAPANVASRAASGAQTVAAAARAAGLTGPTAPRIIPRAGWGADETWRTAPAAYSDTIKVAFVHHTVTASDYSRAQAPAQVRAVYAYDTKGLGISDMGYNFLVDRFGNIYEGRAGGVDQPVIGAHTAGFNSDSFAIAVLGDFQHTRLPAAAAAPIVSAVSAVAGWKLGLFHVDPDAPVDLVSDGFYGTSKYAAGDVAHLPHSLVGHGDIGRTQCPGAYLRAYLDEIRRKARAAQGAILWQPIPSARQWSYKAAASAGSPAAGTGVTVAISASVATGYRVQVLSPCADDPFAVIDGRTSASGTAAASWNGLAPDGTAAAPGDYSIVVQATGATANVMTPASVDIRIAPTDSSPRGPCPQVYQFGTDDPIATDVAASHESAPHSTTAILFSTDKAETAAGLVAATAAAHSGSALLPVGTNLVPYRTVRELTQLQIRSVVLVGRPAAFGAAITPALRKAGVTDISTISQGTFTALSLSVARAYWNRAESPIVAADSDPVQALTQAAALAIQQDQPLLIVDATSLAVPAVSPTAAPATSRPSASVSPSGTAPRPATPTATRRPTATPTHHATSTKRPSPTRQATATRKPTSTKHSTASKKPSSLKHSTATKRATASKKPTSTKRATATTKPTATKRPTSSPSRSGSRKPSPTSHRSSSRPVTSRPVPTPTASHLPSPSPSRTSVTPSASATGSPALFAGLSTGYRSLLMSWGVTNVTSVTMTGSSASKFSDAVPGSVSYTAPAADRLAIAVLRRLPGNDVARVSLVGAAGDGIRSYVAAALRGAPVMVVNSRPSLQFLQWLSATSAVAEVRYYGSPLAIATRDYAVVVAAMKVAAHPSPSPSPTGSPSGSGSPSPTGGPTGSPTSSASATSSPSPSTSPSPTPPAIPIAFNVSGSGFGHGVGLSQYGAQAQALAGRTAAQIISFYYTGAAVTTVRDDQIIAVNVLHRAAKVDLQLHEVDSTPSVPVDDPGAVGDFITGSRSRLSVKGARYRITLDGTAGKPTLVITQIDSSGKQTSFLTTTGVSIHWGGTRDPRRAGTAPAYVDLAGPGEALHDGYGRYRYGDLRVTAVSYVDNGVTKSSIEVANNVRLHDEYLRGIGEVPASWEPAALQAQVIASRGFALAAAKSSVKYTCGCQLYDGTGSQVFAGWMREVGYSASANIARAAQLGVTLPAAITGSPSPSPSRSSATASPTGSPTRSTGSPSPSPTPGPSGTASSSSSATPSPSTTALPSPTTSPSSSASASPSTSPSVSPSPSPSWTPTAELPLPSNFFGRKWDQAVLATSPSLTTGLAATVGGKPIVTYFYSASGGRTENSEDVWGGRLTYARSVADPWSLATCVPAYVRAWTEIISQRDMATFFGLSDVVKVTIGARTEGGAVITMTARSSSGRTSTRYGTDLRRTFDLRSRWIHAIKPRP